MDAVTTESGKATNNGDQASGSATVATRANAIEMKDLTKRFGSLTAVDAITFNVAKGTIFGFLGPNGSGKSTCIRMLCSVLEPTSGSASVNGFDIIRDAESVKRSIGYMNQSFSLYRDLTAEENLRFFGGIYGLKNARLTQRMDEMIHLMGLQNYLGKPSGQLSGGWRQRLALAAALIHEPELVFLDEPTAGIDPVARRELWDLLFDLAGAGKTLFVTTHYMDEAERCNEIAYIYLSKLMVKGTPTELKALQEITPPGTRSVAIATAHPANALMLLKKQTFALDATLVEAEVHLLMPAITDDTEVLNVLKQAGIQDGTSRSIEPSLEDVFVTLTRKLAAE